LHEADAAGAEDAAVGHVEHVGAEVLHRTVSLGVLAVPGAGAPFMEHVVLQLALARLVADRAVEWMVDEQEFEDALPRCLGRGAVDVHDLPVGHGRHAGRGQLGLLLDFDQAHAAHGGRRQRGMVAVVRDENAGLLGGLDDRGALRHRDAGSFNRDCDELVSHGLFGLIRQFNHTPASTGFRAFETYASNSDRNFWIPLTTGAAQESLNTQIVLPVMFSERSRRRSRSSGFPLPARIRSSTFVVHAVPSRHWVHWAHDSWA